MFFQVSGNAVINVIVGGTARWSGALYGSALLTVLKSVVGSFTAHHHHRHRRALRVSVIFFPKGLVGYLCAGAATLAARAFAPAPARSMGRARPVLRGRGLTVQLRRAGGGQRRQLRRAARPHHLGDRPQRCRQEQPVQPDQRRAPAQRGQVLFDGAT
jgi:hypothetical protein